MEEKFWRLEERKIMRKQKIFCEREWKRNVARFGHFSISEGKNCS